MSGMSWRPLAGLMYGTALGFAGAFGGFGAFLVVLVLGVVGLLVGLALTGEYELGDLLARKAPGRRQ